MAQERIQIDQTRLHRQSEHPPYCARSASRKPAFHVFAPDQVGQFCYHQD